MVPIVTKTIIAARVAALTRLPNSDAIQLPEMDTRGLGNPEYRAPQPRRQTYIRPVGIGTLVRSTTRTISSSLALVSV